NLMAPELVAEFTAAFHAADFAEVIRSLDRHFGASTYSLRSLFRDEQREVLRRILASSLESAEGVYRALYEQEAPMMRFLVSLGSPVPRVFQTAAEFFFNSTFRRELEADGKLDVERVWSLVEEARALDVDLDEEGLGYLLSQAIHKMLKDLTENLEDLETLDRLASTADLAQSGPFQADLWEAQNLYYELLQSGYSASLTRARETRETADRPSRDWAEKFEDLGRHLLVRVD
ncbi:MAG: glycoside hydrolase, partial [Chloroflexota bacterium]